MKKLKITLLAILAIGMLSCEKENEGPNSNNGNEDECSCGIVTSSDAYSTTTSNPNGGPGLIEIKWKTKVRNECSNNIKQFNLDYDPQPGEYWCNSNGLSW